MRAQEARALDAGVRRTIVRGAEDMARERCREAEDQVRDAETAADDSSPKPRRSRKNASSRQTLEDERDAALRAAAAERAAEESCAIETEALDKRACQARSRRRLARARQRRD